jgi:hypothetical protein
MMLLEVGEGMLEWLRESYRPTERPPQWAPPPQLGGMFGVPVFLREDLEPGRWQLLDEHGDKIASGTIRCRQP